MENSIKDDSSKEQIEALIKKAERIHRENSCCIDDLKSIAVMFDFPLRTREDFRWYVLFNMVMAIDHKINNDPEHEKWRDDRRKIISEAARCLLNRSL